VAAAKSPDHLALGTAIRAQRHRRKLTLEQLGDLVADGMNPRYISACERGEVNISFGNLLRLCRALEINLSALAASYEQGVGADRR
jgi:transcriptional regulator with XRE-family HTH domain